MAGVSRLGAALLLGVAASTVSFASEALPELPVAEWDGTPVSLEDLRGQLVVIVFYDDNVS
jgi:cytochrome oxidase Cu insertion factor (SCO1/SenC/PrrC family)